MVCQIRNMNAYSVPTVNITCAIRKIPLRRLKEDHHEVRKPTKMFASHTQGQSIYAGTTSGSSTALTC